MPGLKKSNPYSFYSLLAIVLYLSITFISVKGWKADKMMRADRANYYVYLPATFIYHDLHFSYADSLNEYLGTRRVAFFDNEEGRRCQKMTAGVSMMEAPFFLLAHLWASLDSRYEANGYNEVYYFFIGLSALVFALLSMVLLRKILLRFSSDKVTAFVILLFAGGTNLFYYSTYIGGISHNPGLFLLACFFWFSFKWIDTHKVSSLAIALFSLGMAMVVRPTNIIFGLFLLIYIEESGWTYKGLFKDIRQNYGSYIIANLVFFIPLIIQMGLWKYISGHWIQYSYRDEGFFFADPEVLKGLFGGRNSMIPYAPFLIFAFAGIFVPRAKKDNPKYSLILALGVFIYVIYSWWCWWYGGSLGSRAAIESYIILAIFLAYFLEFIWSKFNPKIIIFGLILLSAFSLYFSSLKAIQYKKVILHYDSMTYKAYWDVFLNSNKPENFRDHLQEPDYANAKTIGKEYPNFKKMSSSFPRSEEVLTDLSEINWADQDSLAVNYSIWGSHKIYKKSFVNLVLESTRTDNKISYPIKPNHKNRGWNMGEMKLFIPKELRDEEVKIYYYYIGDFQCFYQDPGLVIPYSLTDLKN